MQFMADAFDDDDEKKWPSIPHPVPGFPAIPKDILTVAERSARAGERQGYEQAYTTVMQLEKVPKSVSVKAAGKTPTISLSGRRLLWLLLRAYHDEVKDLRYSVNSSWSRTEWPS